MVRSGASPRLPAAVGKSLAHAAPTPFWLDQPDAPEPLPALAEHVTTELAVVGGGFTGLWTALLAKERDPSRDVVLLEARTVGWAASGRNGGFCSASLTHGIGNGLERFPEEMPLLEKLGEQNLREIGETIAQARHRLRLPADRRAQRRHRALAARGRARRRRWPRGALGHDVEVLDAERSAASSTRRCWSAASSSPPATRWSSRAGSPGGCAAPAWRRGCGSTSRRRSARSPPAAPG